MGECTITSKICLTGLCLIFWIAGAGLIFIGVEVVATYNHVNQITSAMYTLVPASIIIIVGLFMFILGLVGCIGGCKESKCLLAVFFTLLLVILVCEAAAGFLGFAYRSSVEDALRKGMEKALKNYTDDEDVMHDQVDYIQQSLHCCGVANYTDWFTTPWGTDPDHKNRVPESCCRNESTCHGSGPALKDEIYTKGCLTLLKDKFSTYLGIIAGIAFGFALLELFGMICSCILLCRTQKDLPYSELRDEARGRDVRA